MSDLSEFSTEELLEELKKRILVLESSKPKERYSLKELCAILGVSKFTLQRWCREGMPTSSGKKVELRFTKVGREYVFAGEECRRIQSLRG